MRYAFLRDRSSFRGHTSRRPRAKTPSAAYRSHKCRFLHYTRKTRTAPGTAQNAKKNRWEMEHRKTHPENGAHGLFADSTSRATEAALRLCCLPRRATRVSPSRRKKWLEYAHSAHFSIPHPYRIAALRLCANTAAPLIRSSSRRALPGARRAVLKASIPRAFQPSDTRRPSTR